MKKSNLLTNQRTTHPMVYVVDDDSDCCQMLDLLLESVGLQAAVFLSAREFLDAYDPTIPGCLILDLRMPEMSGLDLMRILATHEECIPVIMLSGFADVPSTVEAMKCGAKDVIEKPYQAQALIEKIQVYVNEDVERCRRKLSDSDVRHNLASLTPRENEVLELLLNGFSAKRISRELEISVRTVDFHRRHVLEKMEIENPVQLARMIDQYRFRQFPATYPR